jgi:hypothetical protein
MKMSFVCRNFRKGVGDAGICNLAWLKGAGQMLGKRGLLMP